MKIAVIGGGSWGTTLADLLANKGYETHLWVREEELVREILHKGENTWFLPGFQLSKSLQVSSDLETVLKGAQISLFVVPCQFLRQVLAQAKRILPREHTLVCANKGIEVENLKTISQVVFEELGDIDPDYAILSGPSFAKEVAGGLPTAVSLGCSNQKTGEYLQEVFSTDTFRVYTNPDYIGVELGGALKNVIAIATGICDGLEFGLDARAALITRGLAEISRMGEAMGASRETFMGLSGLGDLILTCTGELSRNRGVGLRIGKGESLSEILEGMQAVAEGVKTTQAVYNLSRERGVDMPITEKVYQMLFEDKDRVNAVKELMQRTLKQE